MEASSQFAKMSHGPHRAAAELRARQSAAQRIEDIRVMAQSVPRGEDFLWEDHHDASNKLWATDPYPASFEYSGDQLVAASVMTPAELEVSRYFDLDWVAQRIGDPFEATNEKLLDFWQGQVFGIARRPASSAAFNGMTYDGALHGHER